MSGPTSTGNAGGGGVGPEWMGHVPLVVSAHVLPASVLEVSLHPEEGRAVVSIVGSNSASVHLFTPRAELARLIEVASAALAELDAQTVLADSVPDGAATGVESAA